MIHQKIIKFLEKAKVKYEPIKHRTVYTAFDKAQTLKVPEKMVGKTLVLKTDGKLAMALIPANKNLDKEKIKKLLKAKKVELASERLIKNKFKGVKVGAIPPFGNLWPLARLCPVGGNAPEGRGQRPGGGLTTFIDKSLMRQTKIIVNGGDYNWSIKIPPKVLKKLIPDLKIGSFSKKK